MLYSSSIGELKSVLVSSAGPGEGKTTTVANLAITYANLGKKTILVDTDLRRPVVHKVFDLDREPGVTNYLSGQTNDHQSLVKSCEIDNLSIITSGVIPPNPSELLGSARTTELVKNLESEWDMVLFDSPPLIAVTDATMITKEIDQIVLVVKSGQTDKKAFHHTITNLKNN
jgi:capsular exopolysaccharide family